MEFSFHLKTAGELVVITVSQTINGLTTDCNAVMVPVSNGFAVSAIYNQVVWNGSSYSKYEWHNIFVYEMKMPKTQSGVLKVLGM